uniref:NB-ARC domain-containing protein n=1 Tax=Lactuca sativa TaxID=4236 RepID=A0A9R1VM06_LACSA|nr:hypothetical protein LSAT_V11C400215850 [Lactuca sativa]
MLQHKLNRSFLAEKYGDVTVGQLECLENLDFSHTTIKHLPNSTCMLKRLKYLELYDCSLFEKLQEDISQLECLGNLNLMACGCLQDIPNSICEMKCLKYFNLYNCILVEKLSDELGGLECLKELDVKGTSICHLPQSILLLKGLHISGLGQLLESCGFTPTAGVSSTVL